MSIPPLTVLLHVWKMGLRKIFLSAAFLPLLLVTPALGTPLVTNGSFETFTSGNFGGNGYGTSNAAITGWTGFASDGLTRIGLNGTGGSNENSTTFANNGAIPEGAHVGFLQAPGAGTGVYTSLSQNISGLVNGTNYVLSFSVNARNYGGDVPKLTVQLGSQVLQAATSISPVASASNFSAGYQFVSIPFTYSSGWGSILSFIATTPTSDGTILLDNISLVVAAAPDLGLNATIGSVTSPTNSFNSVTGVYSLSAKAMGLMNGGVGTSDNINFVYAQKTGDVELVARVTGLTGPDGCQVGFTMRTGLGTTDQMASCYFIRNYDWGDHVLKNGFLGPMRGPTVDGNPYYYQYLCGAYRPLASLNPPFWMKLVRVGNNYGTYWSVNGKDWVQMSGLSGGAFFATGTYNIGFFIGSASTSTSASATLDNVYVGSPRLKYKSSRVGCNSEGLASGLPGNNIYSLWVSPDGTCYTNSNWAENSTAGRVYKDGKVFHNFFSDPGINGALEGTVTGNGSNIFYYNSVGSPKVFRADFTTANYTALTFASGGTPPIPTLGEVRGLAANASIIFVSDYANGLVRAVDASSLHEIITGNFPIVLPRCGPIAYDGANFWVVQAATQDATGVALSTHTAYVGALRPSIHCYQADGTELTARKISWTDPDTCIPTALAYQDVTPAGPSASDVLWVCDNGPHQYVRKYTNLNGTPTATTPFGQDGGLWAGSHPGQITDSAAGGDRRFYGLTGVGTDSTGNIYVACNGGDGSTVDLRKFNSGGTLQWRVNGLLFLNNGDFDPTSDGQEYYTTEKHFTMNYANTAPGTEWSYKGFTNDIRNNAGARDYGGAKLARIGGNLYMYTYQQGDVGTMRFYCFNGETATLFGSCSFDPATAYFNHIWIDANLNGTVDAGPPNEDTSVAPPVVGGTFRSFDVDTAGDIWLSTEGDIRQIINQGTQTVTNGTISNVVPRYSLGTGTYQDYPIPMPLKTLSQINYDRANDAFYGIGKTADGTWMLIRCDQWRANPESKNSTAKATWATTLPPQSDITMLYPPPAEFTWFGLDVVGGKVFASELYGPIHVYDAALGNEEINLVAGPEISGMAGWDDMTMGISAVKRSTGEYIVTEENAGVGACAIMYRWTPSADTAVTSAPVLTATAAGGKVVLTWSGPIGMVTSYNVYRGTTSGGETLYQSGLTSPTFTDLNVTPGTTYYYKVVAVNAAGDSAQSNEVSASASGSLAEFVKSDTTTQGLWYTGSTPIPANCVYGSEGYHFEDPTVHSPVVPSYVNSEGPTPGSFLIGRWAPPDPSTEARFLRMTTGTTSDRTSYTWCPSANNQWTWDIDFKSTDTDWHQVSIYLVFGPYAATEKIEIIDPAGKVLDTRNSGNYMQGKWMVWNVRGDVSIRFTGDYGPPFCSGVFFDPVKVSTPAIGWWKMDDTGGTNYTAADSSGAGHHGTRTSTTTWNTSGKINGCVSIPGGYTARVNLPGSLITNRFPITLSAWFKTTSVWGTVIASYDTGGSSPTEYDPLLYVGMDGKLRGSYYTAPGPTAYTRVMSSAATANDGQWHHAALVADKSTQALYLDGVLVDYRAATFSSTVLGTNYIGYGSTGAWPQGGSSPNSFNGYLDDVRIYDKALNASEIYQLYHHP